MHSEILRRQIKASQSRSKFEPGLQKLSSLFMEDATERLERRLHNPSFKNTESTRSTYSSFLNQCGEQVGCFATQRTILVFSQAFVNYLVGYTLDEKNGLSLDGKAADRDLCGMDLVICEPIAEKLFESYMGAVRQQGEHYDPAEFTITNRTMDIQKVSVFDKDDDICRLSFDYGNVENAFMFASHIGQLEISINQRPDNHNDKLEQSQYWRDHMRKTIADLPISLETVIETTQESIGKISDLHVGDCIALPRENLSTVQAIIRLPNGTPTIINGELGALRGHKAIRLSHGVDAGVHAEVNDLLAGRLKIKDLR